LYARKHFLTTFVSKQKQVRNHEKYCSHWPGNTLLVYVALIITGYAYPVIVLKDNSEEYPELGCNKELGYRDRQKETLGLF